MTIIALDYGTKRLGVALSDEGERLAFPKATLPNDRHLLATLLELIDGYQAHTVLLGESKDFSGKDNPIMPAARRLAAALISERPELKIEWESELYSSEAAKRWQDKREMVDASAATVMLASYLERQA